MGGEESLNLLLFKPVKIAYVSSSGFSNSVISETNIVT